MCARRGKAMREDDYRRTNLQKTNQPNLSNEKKMKHLTFCAGDQSGFFDTEDILEAAYFCNSRTDLSTHIQILIKHTIMLTALNSIH